MRGNTQDWRRWVLGTVSGIGALGAVVILHGATIGAAAPAAPTFTKDVAPIFQQKCETCHRADGMAPMSLATFEDTRPWVKSIAQRVGTRQMPPWHIDKTVGIQKFKNDRSLSDDQIDTVVKWINNAAPKGDDPKEHARADQVARRAVVAGSDHARAARSRHLVHAVDREGGGPRRGGGVRPIPTGLDRAALGARHRDSPRDR